MIDFIFWVRDHTSIGWFQPVEWVSVTAGFAISVVLSPIAAVVYGYKVLSGRVP